MLKLVGLALWKILVIFGHVEHILEPILITYINISLQAFILYYSCSIFNFFIRNKIKWCSNKYIFVFTSSWHPCTPRRCSCRAWGGRGWARGWSRSSGAWWTARGSWPARPRRWVGGRWSLRRHSCLGAPTWSQEAVQCAARRTRWLLLETKGNQTSFNQSINQSSK